MVGALVTGEINMASTALSLLPWLTVHATVYLLMTSGAAADLDDYNSDDNAVDAVVALAATVFVVHIVVYLASLAAALLVLVKQVRYHDHCPVHMYTSL